MNNEGIYNLKDGMKLVEHEKVMAKRRDDSMKRATKAQSQVTCLQASCYSLLTLAAIFIGLMLINGIVDQIRNLF